MVGGGWWGHVWSWLALFILGDLGSEKGCVEEEKRIAVAHLEVKVEASGCFLLFCETHFYFLGPGNICFLLLSMTCPLT